MGKKPAIECDAVHPTLEVRDVKAAAEYYRDTLGFEIDFLWGDPAEHASVSLGQVSIHFSGDEPNPSGFWIYHVVDDVDGLHAWYRSNAVKIIDAPTTQPWGMREFNIKDPNGYVLRFGEPDMRAGAPLQVERVDVNARLEKRLAALMSDLAAHKRMTVGEMLEEVLLHSFEALPGAEGQAVASPHTRRSLQFIEELKQRHGIDYDTHDSYRFSEA